MAQVSWGGGAPARRRARARAPRKPGSAPRLAPGARHGAGPRGQGASRRAALKKQGGKLARARATRGSVGAALGAWPAEVIPRQTQHWVVGETGCVVCARGGMWRRCTGWGQKKKQRALAVGGYARDTWERVGAGGWGAPAQWRLRRTVNTGGAAGGSNTSSGGATRGTCGARPCPSCAWCCGEGVRHAQWHSPVAGEQQGAAAPPSSAGDQGCGGGPPQAGRGAAGAGGGDQGRTARGWGSSGLGAAGGRCGIRARTPLGRGRRRARMGGRERW